MNEKKVFAKGFCFDKLFWVFVIACIFGAYYEEILVLVKAFIHEQPLLWSRRRGVLYGPFSPVYGFGAVLMIYLFGRKKYPWFQLFIFGAFFGGVFEYTISWLQEIFVGTSSWNYSKQILSIGGRTTIPIMMGWGLLTVFLIKFIYPKISNILEHIPYTIGKKITQWMVIILVVDMLISWTAILRWNLRHHHVEPITPVGKIYDRIYTDDYLKHRFPNMEVVK